jgi:hypothetical protein
MVVAHSGLGPVRLASRASGSAAGLSYPKAEETRVTNRDQGHLLAALLGVVALIHQLIDPGFTD